MNATITVIKKPEKNQTKKRLRAMQISETVFETFNNVDEARYTSIRNIVSQLRKEGLDFTTSHDKNAGVCYVWRDL